MDNRQRERSDRRRLVHARSAGLGRRNLGGRLVQAVVEIAATRGCAEIGLYLLESTEPNRPFYAKYGFEGVGSEMRQRLSA